MPFIDLEQVKLCYASVGDTHRYPPLIFLHGIMGNKKNLEHFVKKLMAQLPEKSALIFDLRNHGDSSKHSSPFTVEACAEDLAIAIQKLGLKPTAAIGHSFGGKVALILAEKLGYLEQVWLLDCPPGKIEKKPTKHFNAFDILDKLLLIRFPVKTRNDLVAELLVHEVSREVALWMTTNLRQQEDGFYLNFYPEDLKKMLDDFIGIDLWPLVKSVSVGTQAHLVAAEHGGRISEHDQSEWIRLTGSRNFHLLKSSGHLVHIDNPGDLIEILKKAE